MKTCTLLTTTLLLWLALATTLSAQDGSAVLARIDSVLNAPRDLTALEKMVLIDKSGKQKVREVKIYQKGSERRLVRFLAPADVRGVGFLRLAEDRLYLYLPAFRKVRRIASSVKNESFMGTDFSYEDLSRSQYGDDFAVQGVEEQNGQLVLNLVPKAGADVSYGRVKLWVDRTNYVVRKAELYSKSGKLEKVLRVDEVELIDGYWIGKRMEMETVKDNHRTVLTLKEVAFDQGLSDALFTQRNLKRVKR